MGKCTSSRQPQIQPTRVVDTDEDKAMLANLQVDGDTPRYLADILGEAIDMLSDINGGLGGRDPIDSPMAYASRVWNPDGTLAYQEVRYRASEPDERKRAGNLVHELTHAKVLKAFNRDYINYTDAPEGDREIPDPIFNGGDPNRLTNEEAIQTARINSAANQAIVVILQNLITDATNDGALDEATTREINDKLLYGATNPQKEFDTVISQIAVWLSYWDLTPTNSNFAQNLIAQAEENTRTRGLGVRIMGG